MISLSSSLPRLALPLSTLLLAACGASVPRSTQVTEVWVRLPAVPGRPGAAYFTLTGGAEPSRLVAIESPAAARIELHQSGMADGRMTMRRLDGVGVATGQTVRFAPEGYHAMLFGVPATARPGQTVRMSFRFEKGDAISAEGKLVGAGDDAPY